MNVDYEEAQDGRENCRAGTTRAASPSSTPAARVVPALRDNVCELNLTA
ncbi:hypothetical protein [Undibacterium seohonense]|nr:hypothetical protein [Undibacterium seohonense]